MCIGGQISIRQLSRLFIRFIALLGFGTTFVALYVNSASSQNLAISDYDVPVSRAERMDVAAMFYITGQDRATYKAYEGSLAWMRYYTSLPFAWWTYLDAGIDIRSKHGSRTTYSEDIYFSGNIHKYLKDDGLFFGGLSAYAIWRHDYQHVHSWINATAGLGRYIVATSLAKAIRIDQFLISEKVINNHLPKETLLQLANVIGRQNEYEKLYGDTYRVWWYADMEQAIVASGQVPNDTIGAVGQLRMREVIERENVRPRWHGWKLEIGIGAYLSQRSRTGIYGTDPRISWAWSYPIALKSQVNLQGFAEGDVGDEFGEAFLIEGSITYSYEITNRIDIYIEDWVRYWERPGNFTHFNTITNLNNTMRIGFDCYLENQMSVNVYARIAGKMEKYRELLNGEWGHYRRERRSSLIGFSINYRVF